MKKVLGRVVTTKKTGNEPFTFNDKDLPINVLSFWQWSNSELLGNALRGVLAEYIVASALDCLDSLRVEWDAYDLLTQTDIKVEVKSSSYLQSWQQTDYSKISFDIKPTQLFGKVDNNPLKRQANVYVFCLLAHKDKATVDPLDLNQWEFYVVRTATLDKDLGNQKTLSLSRLKKVEHKKVNYAELRQAVETAN